MKIIKRDCTEVDFDKNKIYIAIMNAMRFGSGVVKPQIAKEISDEIESECFKSNGEVSVYDVEAMVFSKLCDKGENQTAKAYEGYRSIREFQRDCRNSTDDSIVDLLLGKSEYWNEENSNKNAVLVQLKGIIWQELKAKILPEGCSFPRI